MDKGKCIKCGEKEKHSTTSYCRDCRTKYNNLNKEQIKNYNKQRYESDQKPIIKEKIKKYASKNKEAIQEYTKNWFQDNKGHINEYNRNKYKTDPIFKLKLILRNSIKQQLKLKGGTKPDKTLELLGCTLEEFKLHLESQFEKEMNWENHGPIWEIDHIESCFNFDLTKEEEIRKCFHYTNLRPLFKTTKIAEFLGYKGYIGNRNRDKI